MIEDQVQEVLDLLNSELHGRLDYTLFSKIFDAVGSIDIPNDYKLVPVETTDEMINTYRDKSIAPISTLSVIGYKAMIGAAP